MYIMTKRILWDEKNIKTRIVDKYYIVIEELLNQLEKILTNVSDIDISTCMFIGLNSIYRVFEYVLIKTKNIEKAYYYAQKTYFYYIEYMEQIHKTNLQNALNQTDAVLFIYKKTIFEIQSGNDGKLFDTITNIMTFEEEITHLNSKEYYELLTNLHNIVNIFFYWNNPAITFQERLQLSKLYLKKYMLSYEYLQDIYYLELIQEKVQLEYATYSSLVDEFLNFQIKNKKNRVLDEELKNEYMLKFYIEKNIMYENLKNKNIKGLLNWLYQPIMLS